MVLLACGILYPSAFGGTEPICICTPISCPDSRCRIMLSKPLIRSPLRTIACPSPPVRMPPDLSVSSNFPCWLTFGLLTVTRPCTHVVILFSRTLAAGLRPVTPVRRSKRWPSEPTSCTWSRRKPAECSESLLYRFQGLGFEMRRLQLSLTEPLLPQLRLPVFTPLRNDVHREWGTLRLSFLCRNYSLRDNSPHVLS